MQVLRLHECTIIIVSKMCAYKSQRIIEKVQGLVSDDGMIVFLPSYVVFNKKGEIAACKFNHNFL